LSSDLTYDLVLMRSYDSERVSAYLYQGLTTDNPYKQLEVFHYDEDVPFGNSEFCLMSRLCT